MLFGTSDQILKWPVLSTKFQMPFDSSWQGFRDAYKRLTKQAVIIIDLRGNQGGDDTRGSELAKSISDGPPPFNAEQLGIANTV